MPFDISPRSFDGRGAERSDSGILLSLGLRSVRGLLLLSNAPVHACFLGLYFGMRLEVARVFDESDVLFDREGREGAGEPGDRGCETQSSDNESNHACSIVMGLLKLYKLLGLASFERHGRAIVDVDFSKRPLIFAFLREPKNFDIAENISIQAAYL